MHSIMHSIMHSTMHTGICEQVKISPEKTMRKLPEHGSCFVCGSSNPHSLGLAWYTDAGKNIHAEYTFSENQQGPPGHVHGGASAAVLDEAMGAAVWVAGLQVVAARLEVDYKRPLPLGEKVVIRARISEQHERKTFATAEIVLANGETAVAGKGIYVTAPHLFINTKFENIEPQHGNKGEPMQQIRATLSASAQKVQNALAERIPGLKVIEFTESTRTSAEAAERVGVSLGQIAKSLIFKAKESGKPVLVIASGANRVDEKKVAALLGEKIGRADPEFAREATGFVIGGIPPFGHSQPITTFLDADLFRYEIIWAAAGTPNAVFELTPAQLSELTGGLIAETKE